MSQRHFPLVFQFETLDANSLYSSSYNPVWIVVSILISILSAYAALNAATEICSQKNKFTKLNWTLVSAFTLGVGIWAMHFIGMLALHLPCHVHFDLVTTIISIIPSILVSGLALSISDCPDLKHVPLWFRSLLLGVGVGTMHYTGMAAMRLDGELRYHPLLFGLSIVVAIFLSYIALHIKNFVITKNKKQMLMVAIVVGFAVSGMHYTAMSATYFVKNDAILEIDNALWNQSNIALFVTVITTFIALVSLTLAIFSRNRDIRNRLQQSNSETLLLLNSMAEGAYGVDMNGHCRFVNNSFLKILGYEHADEIIGQHIHTLIHHSYLDGQPYPATKCKMYKAYQENKNVYVSDEVFWKKDGTAVPVEYWSQPLVSEGVLLGAIATFTDISERQAVEQELRIAAKAFESGLGVIVTDADVNIMRVNKSFTIITGYLAEDVMGKNPHILSSTRHDDRFYKAMWNEIQKTGHWEGEIWNCNKKGDIYPEYLSIAAVKNENEIVTNYVATFSDISALKKANDEIEKLAFYDPLTNLPNRRLLFDRLKQALSLSKHNKLKGALLFLDMDNFKILNDTLGHDIGDLLLKQVAQRLKSCVSDYDTVARLGGDEFVVIIEELSSDELEASSDVKAISERILIALSQNYNLQSSDYKCTLSIGITIFDCNATSIEELLKQADIAMYQAKMAGRNTIRFFDSNMQEAIDNRVTLERDLQLALELQQFQLYYQAQVHTQKDIIGAEVLIRWLHPQRGLVSPAEFIPLAEETGLVIPIGQWVLETACFQIKQWENTAMQHLQLSVNVSAKQFHKSNFVEKVHDVLIRTQIKPSCLKLELTESLLFDNADEIIARMNTLKKLGVCFSMDDFGTGYSSLSYLTRLPLDQLKIDQAFVRNIGVTNSNSIIIQTIIAMTQSLGMDVIAEGVETNEQYDFLQQHNCHTYQGYLFSKPIPVKEFELLIMQNYYCKEKRPDLSHTYNREMIINR